MKKLFALCLAVLTVSCSHYHSSHVFIDHPYEPYPIPKTYLCEMSTDTRMSSWQERQIPESIANRTLDEIITEAKTNVINKHDPKLQIAVIDYIYSRDCKENETHEKYYSLMPTVVKGHINYDQGTVQSYYFDRIDMQLLTIADLKVLKDLLEKTQNPFLTGSLSAILMGHVDRIYERKMLTKLFSFLKSKEVSLLLTNPGPPDFEGVGVRIQEFLTRWEPKESIIEFIDEYNAPDRETRKICKQILSKLKAEN